MSNWTCFIWGAPPVHYGKSQTQGNVSGVTNWRICTSVWKWTGEQWKTLVSAQKHWKSQEVASYSPAYQSLFFLFFLCTRQCLLIAMIIIAIHPHCAALFCVTALKASTAAVQRWFDNVHIPSHTGHLGGTTTLNTESQRTKQNTATYSRGHNILYPQKSY